MSLDVYLENATATTERPLIYIRENGAMVVLTREEWDKRFPDREPVTVAPRETAECYWRNITHNLGKMAAEAGIYEVLWRPEELCLVKAHQLVGPLTEGLERLTSDPEKYRAFNPANGWGDYDGLVAFVTEYLAACIANPDADVKVSR
jgi:hypothetical protein